MTTTWTPSSTSTWRAPCRRACVVTWCWVAGATWWPETASSWPRTTSTLWFTWWRWETDSSPSSSEAWNSEVTDKKQFFVWNAWKILLNIARRTLRDKVLVKLLMIIIRTLVVCRKNCIHKYWNQGTISSKSCNGSSFARMESPWQQPEFCFLIGYNKHGCCYHSRMAIIATFLPNFCILIDNTIIKTYNHSVSPLSRITDYFCYKLVDTHGFMSKHFTHISFWDTSFWKREDFIIK